MVIFSWDTEKKQKRITWELTLDDRAVGLAESIKYRHNYVIMSSANAMKPMLMKRADGGNGIFEYSFRIGLSGHEEFHFLRDGDKHQIVYPAKNRSLTRDVPVRGPDHLGEDKFWSVIGETGEMVNLQLQVVDGEFNLTIAQQNAGTKVFKSLEGTFRRKYFVYAQWTNWGFTAMSPSSTQGAYRCEMKMPEAGVSTFQIVIDENPNQAIYPELEYADQLISPAVGPDAKGPNLCWAIAAPPGSILEVRLDLGAADRREMVTWRTTQEAQALTL